MPYFIILRLFHRIFAEHNMFRALSSPSSKANSRWLGLFDELCSYAELLACCPSALYTNVSILKIVHRVTLLWRSSVKKNVPLDYNSLCCLKFIHLCSIGSSLVDIMSFFEPDVLPVDSNSSGSPALPRGSMAQAMICNQIVHVDPTKANPEYIEFNDQVCFNSSFLGIFIFVFCFCAQ